MLGAPWVRLLLSQESLEWGWVVPRLLSGLAGQLWMMLGTLVGPAELVLTHVSGARTCGFDGKLDRHWF